MAPPEVRGPSARSRGAARTGAALILAILLAAGTLAGGALLLRGGAGSRPDLVLVVWDTCRGDRVTVNGYAHPTTPGLAEFAGDAVVFRNGFTPSPWTPPAHASIFTGLLPRHHGLEGRMADRVNPGIPLLAETLRKGGYETVGIVANPQISGVTCLDAGFDRFVPLWREGGAKGTASGALAAVDAWLAERAARGGKRRPAFLFVNLMETHIPYSFEAAAVSEVRGDAAVNGARAAAEKVGEREANVHCLGLEPLDPGTVKGLDAAYDGSVRLVDRATKGLLDRLRGAGLLDGLAVVCADHGENLGEHGLLGHQLSVFETVLHVPLVVRWPGRFDGGRVVEEQVRLQDLYPTFLEAAGLRAPPSCGADAVSLTETPLRSRVLVAEYGPMNDFLGELRKAMPRATAGVFEVFSTRFRAVRDPAGPPGPRKLVLRTRMPPDGEPSPAGEELYDPVADPGEERNLLVPGAAPAEAAAAARLRALGEGKR